MNHIKFGNLLESRFKKMRATLTAKSKEYSTDDDKLHNFKSGAEISLMSPAQVCFGYMLKHIVSIRDLVDRGRPLAAMMDSVDEWDKMIDEKIGDCMCYLVLLEALLIESTTY